MALNELNFSFSGNENSQTIPIDWSHSGVVGSGDLEILIRRADINNKVEFKVITPVKGFDVVWEKVLERFVKESNIGDVKIHINDNNATPFVVTLRLKQAVIEMENKA